jgi:uncharacterized repeat protein (TIGR03803 family)
MTRPQQNPISLTAIPFLVPALFILLATSIAAHAQTYSVIHKFSGRPDGYHPTSTLILDRAGNLYGTDEYGGTWSNGVVFKLQPVGSGWILRPLYYFGQETGNGWWPLDYGGLTFGPDGALYGSASYGGIYGCGEGLSYCGTIFQLQPPPTACTSAVCLWDFSLVYQFSPSIQIGGPESSLVFDTAGNIYGTGPFGTIYELSQSGGIWNYSLLGYLSEDDYTNAGMIKDSAGNFYGTWYSYHNNGGVFELSPSSSGWTETVLYTFTGGSDGFSPLAGLVFDSAGNLYGSTSTGGSGGGGAVFELSPSGNGWTYNFICSLQGYSPMSGPQSALTLDSQGSLYGTTYSGGGFGAGEVFKATRSGNNWSCSDLYDFQQNGNGVFPIAGVTLDSHGNLYGTTPLGGTSDPDYCGSGGCGVVWEITP